MLSRSWYKSTEVGAVVQVAEKAESTQACFGTKRLGCAAVTITVSSLLYTITGLGSPLKGTFLPCCVLALTWEGKGRPLKSCWPLKSFISPDKSMFTILSKTSHDGEAFSSSDCASSFSWEIFPGCLKPVKKCNLSSSFLFFHSWWLIIHSLTDISPQTPYW